MKMIKKIIVGLTIIPAILLGNILAADLGIKAPVSHSSTAYAEDWCSGWSKGIVKCPTDSISFTQYSGKLISLDPEGYDPAITQSKNIRDFVQKLVNWALSFLGFISVILFIYAGFLYITAAGESEKADKSKKIMTYTVIGVLIIMGSYAIVNTILNGPFSGGENVYGEGQGYYVNGFNAPTEEIMSSAQKLVEGYQALYDSVDVLRAIQSETDKVNITPDLTKTLKLQYLSSVKSRLRDLKYNSVAFSSANTKVNNLLLEIDKQIYTLQSTPDVVTPEPEEGGGGGAGGSGVEQIQSAITSSDGKDIYAILTDIKKDFVGEKPEIFSQPISKMSCSLLDEGEKPTGVLGDHVCTLKNVYNEMIGLEIFKDTDIPKIYEKLNTLVADLSSKISGTGNDMDLTPANQSLVNIIQTEDQLVKELKDIQFVQTKLVADIVEGSAPLIVKFNVLNSQDPSGKSIDQDTQIIWDLKGNDKAANGSTPLVVVPDECRTRGETSSDDVRTGFNNYCIYKDPGTYRATVSITSSEPSKYATGVSAVDIRVYPPKVMVNLEASVGGKSYSLSKFDSTGFLISSTDMLSITKEEGKSGVAFTAAPAESNPQEIVSHKWEFGDGTKEESATPLSHPYEGEGTYQVVYEATSIDGNTFRKIMTVYVGSPAARIDVLPGVKTRVNDTLTFDGSRSTSDAGKIASYTWELKEKDATGDAAKNLLTESTAKTVNYTFTKSGTYTVSLKVRDSTTQEDTAVVEIKVVSLPPVAKFTYTIPSQNYPSKVYFDASDSYDPDGEFKDIRFEWSVKSKIAEDTTEVFKFIDSTATDETGQSNMSPKIAFNKIGEYDVGLKTYSEEEYKTDKTKFTTTSQTIKIDNILDIEWSKNQKPTAVLDDKGDAELEFAFNSDQGKAYEINFGDGTSETGEIKTRETLVPHIYKVAGKYDVKVVVYDADDNSNQIKKKIFIGGGDKPISKITAYVNGEEVEDTGDGMVISRADQVTFDASASKNRDGTARNLKYFWDFGDKGTSSKKTIFHNYVELSPEDRGYYKVTLKVVDINDESLFDETEIKVKVSSLDPKFTSIQVLPRAGSKLITPMYVNANVYGAIDKDGKVTQYRWWYYDTKKPDDILGIQITDIPNATLIIGTNGEEGDEKTYGFGLEITDNENNKFSSDEIEGEKMPTVTAKNGANALPLAKFTVDRTKVFAGEPINFTSASTDPDGEIVKYIWDFEGDGFFNNDPTTLSTMQKTFTKKNLDGIKVRLKVMDDKYGESISEAVTIYIDSNAKAPKAAFKAEVLDGKTVQFTSNSVSDTTAGVQIESYKWDFDTTSQYKTADLDGDGKKDNDVNSTATDPVFTYDEFGVYQIKLTVMDTQGNESFVTNQVNIAPSASSLTPGLGTTTGTTNDPLTRDPAGSLLGGTTTGTPGSLGTEPGSLQSTLKAVIITKPAVSADGLLRIPGTAGVVTFDFSKSTGDISYYAFDKNIYIDTNKDGNPANEEDFKTYLPGEWTTNFDKAYGKTVIRLTVYDINGNKDSTVQEIIFQ